MDARADWVRSSLLTWGEADFGADRATTADLAAIHRVLLFLPPLPPPKPQRLTLPRTLPTLHNLGVAPSASLPHPSYRNSLVLLDQSTNEILSVLPLSTPAAEESLLPMVDLSLQANPGRGAKLAAQVDEITDGMFPGRKLGGDRSAVERNGEEPQGRGEAMSGQDGNADGVYLALVDEVEKVEKELVKREDRCVATEESTVGQRTLERREVGFTLLDAELGSLRAFETKQHVEARTVGFASQTSDHSLDFFLADDEPSPCRPHSLRSISSNLPRTNLESEARPTSTTSFASIGTQFFETASEGGRTAFGTAAEGESEADSRRTSSATFASDWTEQGRALRAQELDVEDASDDDRTPRPSLLLDHHLAPHVEDNAVLLQFFGESSTITVGRVSGKEIGERGLVPATGEAGWGWLDVLGLGEVVKGLGSWFGGWWRSVRSVGFSSELLLTDSAEPPRPRRRFRAPTPPLPPAPPLRPPTSSPRSTPRHWRLLLVLSRAVDERTGRRRVG